MNRTIARALVEDAFQQVLDNKVFRLLLVFVLGIVSIFFVIGFREDNVQVLFGWRSVEYADVLAFFGRGIRGVADPQGWVIEGVESLLVETLAGNVAMMFCIAATAFFVPRMLEKGAADVLFSKPVSRPVLLFSRWVSGLLFVAILAAVLLSGIWLGLLLVSGYNDPGILWGVVTLVYLYGIVHAFSIVVGVLTRSTVAAILLTLMLFMGSGCVHKAWRFFEFSHETKLAARLAGDQDGDDPKAKAVREKSLQDFDGLVGWVAGIVAPVHYVLPKTSDADVLTKKLRRAIEGGEIRLVDEEGQLSVGRALEDFELRSPDATKVVDGRLEADLGVQPAVWEAVSEGRVVARIELRRSSRSEPPAPSDDSARQRSRRISVSAAVDRARERLRERLPGAPEPALRKEALGAIQNVSFLSWNEPGSPRSARSLALWTSGDWLFELEVEAEPDWAGADFRSPRVRQFQGRFHPGTGLETFDAAGWYEGQFGWTARWKYNAFFSIGSSLAFVVACFLAAHVKLRRLDL